MPVQKKQEKNEDKAHRVSTKWIRHLKDRETKDKFIERLYGYTDILDVLRNILREDLEESVRAMRYSENYTLPNWAEFQADSIGTQRTLTKVIELITLTKE